MERKNLLIQRTLQSLIKYGSFLVIIMTVVFACSDTSEAEETTIDDPVANLTFKTDGAIMGSVIAPNAAVEIIAANSEDMIIGTTNENGEFFITGFEAGTYTIKISTENSEKEEIFNDVEVIIGEVTALGTVDLAAQ